MKLIKIIQPAKGNETVKFFTSTVRLRMDMTWILFFFFLLKRGKIQNKWFYISGKNKIPGDRSPDETSAGDTDIRYIRFLNSLFV